MSSRRSRSGGMLDRDAFDAKVEVLAKMFFGDHLIERLVGGADEPDIDIKRLIGAEANDLAVFQDAKQLGLHRLRHVADLVHEKRAMIRMFKAAFAVGVRRR